MYCILATYYIEGASQTVQFILRTYNRSFTDKLLCDTSIHSHLDSYALGVVYLVELFIGGSGILIIFIPYTGFGLCTMYVLLSRLCKGKTGYRTHFISFSPVHSSNPDNISIYVLIFLFSEYYISCTLQLDLYFQVFLLITFYFWGISIII